VARTGRGTQGEPWEFVESSLFQQARPTHLTDVELDALKELIPRHSNKWIRLRNGPGLFALHWGASAPCTIVFAVSPEFRKVYLLSVEAGTHHTVSSEVANALPSYWVRLKKAGVRIAVWGAIKDAVRWLMENSPF
jgi:hypothetical protein